MGYPTSVQSFTNKNSGDVIQPAHVNDLQTEVAALETGLLNGLSHSFTANAGFQSSNSTFATRPVMPPPECAKVYLDSTVTLGSSAGSTLSWLASDFKTNSSVHSSVTNPDRLTPQSTGIFRFTAQIEFTAVSSGHRAVAIQDSSNAFIGSVDFDASTVAGVVTRIQASGLKRFDVTGGYASVLIGMSGASTLSLSTGSGITWFSMEKL